MLLNTVRAHLRYAGSGRGGRRGDSGVGTCRRGDTRHLASGYTWAWRCVHLSVCVCVYVYGYLGASIRCGVVGAYENERERECVCVCEREREREVY